MQIKNMLLLPQHTTNTNTKTDSTTATKSHSGHLERRHHHHHRRHEQQQHLHLHQQNKYFWIICAYLILNGFNTMQCQATPQASSASTAPQKFRVTPHDVHILEGTDTLLRCEVDYRAGQVQWTKDGFALGFSAVIHGFPRYSVLVDAANGVYNLQIKNASLEDDAEYQCQVGPAPGNPAIRANAKLSIFAAPRSISIEGFSNKAKVEVIEKQNVTLKCVTENANPAAEIVWYQGNAPITVAPIVTVNQTTLKRFRTTSIITIQPQADDDGKDYACIARHKALLPDVPMRAKVVVSVLYPPGPPFFEGLSQDETLRRGQKVQVACRSRGGNPPAQLVWYKNGVPIASPQRTSGRLSENVYKFVAEPSDNGANLACEAQNILVNSPLRADLNLTVYFAPEEVTIKGPKDAKVGDSVQLSCLTTASNPPARLSWSLNGRPFANSNFKAVESNDGGWVSMSNITLNIDAQRRTYAVVCHALNTELTQNVVASHSVHVLYPPSSPLLTGYNDGDIIISGSVKRLQCSSAGGNPPPTLTWYKNDKKLHSTSKVIDSKITSDLSILVNASDNNAIYKCEIQSPAIEIPLFATKTLSVHFPPETIKIGVVPKNLVPGIRAKLVCDSSSSNPPAKVSWWRDGIPVEGVNLSTKPGLWGGSVSTLELFINVTQDMDGIVYTCQSNNEVLQRSVHETIALDVLYPPKFDPMQSANYLGVEGEFMSIALQATGNPMAISYTWSKDGLPIKTSNANNAQRILAEGGVLNITKLSRNDAGSYICEAMNSQGSAIFEIQIAIEYPPTVEPVSNGNSFIINDDAIIACSIDARPLSAEHVHWNRSGFDLNSERFETTFENGTSYLHIKNVQRTDMGNFTCIADNGRGASSETNVLLIVQTAPEIDHSPIYLRFAGRLGERSQLTCRAYGAPQPTFIWRRNGRDLKIPKRNKLKAIERKIDALTYEGTLSIENIGNEDYGQYECIVRNTHGQASTTLEFSKPTRPDTPLDLRILNVTDDGASVTWTPGFSGGLQVYYRLRYKTVSESKYKTAEVKPGHVNMSLNGLKYGTAYVVSVMAANEAGGSKFSPDIKFIIGKDVQPSAAEFTEKDKMPNFMIIGITSAAMVLLVLNAALVAWFVIRRQTKNAAAPDNQADDAYSKDDNQSVYKLPITALQADVQKKAAAAAAASTYLVENVDIIQSTAYPPKYQESSMCTPPYVVCSPDFTRTLPNPRRQSQMSINGNLPEMIRSKDDHHTLVSNGLYIPSPSPASSLVIKGSYISSPSPAPPPDGSYFNMSDKYISYPPVAY